jgi:hypothetical protein
VIKKEGRTIQAVAVVRTGRLPGCFYSAKWIVCGHIRVG